MMMVMTRGVPNTSGMNEGDKDKEGGRRRGGGTVAGTVAKRPFIRSQWPHFPSSPAVIALLANRDIMNLF